MCDQLVFSSFYHQDDDIFLEMESENNDNNRQDFDEVEPSENNISFSGIEEEGEDEKFFKFDGQLRFKGILQPKRTTIFNSLTVWEMYGDIF